jgi:hypothetical protein
MSELYNEDAHEIYNRLFPYYAQTCTVTRFRQRAFSVGPARVPAYPHYLELATGALLLLAVAGFVVLGRLG